MPSQSTDDIHSSAVDDITFSRRGFGKRLLLSASALAVLFAGKQEEAQAAPAGDPWKLGGNSNITNTGTNFLGTINNAPLIIKTNGAERMRITEIGWVGIRTTNPLSILHAKASGKFGIIGETPSTAAGATGVQGVVTPTAPGSNSAGVRGVNNGTNENGAGVHGTHAGDGYGVLGENQGSNTSSAGVRGIHAGGGSGVYGTGPVGVRGEGNTYGILGSASSGTGVKGICFAPGSSINAVFGEVYGQDSTGVRGEANYGGQAKAIWGLSTSGYAGYFSGTVLVTGTFYKGGGAFKIDHPLAPDTKYLSHSFVESPDMMNVYNGNVTTDVKGEATVELPVYFEALNRDFRYQLTVIGQFAQAIVSKEIADNRFSIKTDKPTVKVSWQVTGIRQDAFANANRIQVEEDKPEKERGTYLHPKAHGKPE